MRIVPAIVAIGLWVTALSPAPARSGNDTVLYRANTEYVEIDVRADDRLKAYPRLYAIIVHEGEKFGAESEADVASQWREDKSAFHNMAYSFSRHYRLRAAAGKYVSLAIDESFYTGGAHPNGDTDTLLWDRENDSHADFRTLFVDTTDNGPAMTSLAKLIRAAVAAEKKKRDIEVGDPDTDEWLSEVKAEFKTFGAPSLAPSTVAEKSSGVTFHFSPYAVGPYVEGFFTAFIPAAAVKPYLTAEAQKLFGGERPQDDERQ